MNCSRTCPKGLNPGKAVASIKKKMLTFCWEHSVMLILEAKDYPQRNVIRLIWSSGEHSPFDLDFHCNNYSTPRLHPFTNSPFNMRNGLARVQALGT
eukprot:scaffold451_cov129-Ochromonas_danica.AAC.1